MKNEKNTDLLKTGGSKGGEAASAIRSVLTKLYAKPMEGVAVMEELGISLINEEGETKSLEKIMEELQEALSLGCSIKPKIFISGKITGDPNYKAKFAAAADFYKKRGYSVLNPAVLPGGMLSADYMRICFAMIDTADAVAFLPDYKKSAGAELEHAYCCYTDKSIHHLEDDIGREPYAAEAAAEIVQPMAAPVIKVNLGDPSEEIKKALEKDLYKGIYPNILEGACR